MKTNSDGYSLLKSIDETTNKFNQRLEEILCRARMGLILLTTSANVSIIGEKGRMCGTTPRHLFFITSSNDT